MGKAPRRFPSFSLQRWQIGFNVAVQVLILAGLLLMVNYLGLTRYQRWDLSRYNRYSLSELTRRLLGSLKKEARIYVLFSSRDTMPGGQILFDDVRNLLKEYETAAKRRLRVEIVDLYGDVTKAKLLQDRFHFGPQKDLIIIEYLNRHKTVRVEDLAEFAPEGLFGTTPQLKAFRGEQVLTSALLELVEGRQPRVGIVTGHGESDVLDGSGLQRFKAMAEQQGIRCEEVNLATSEHALADYRALLIIGPRNDLSPQEVNVLRAYWNAQGRILILLNPRSSTPLLNEFLDGYGIRADEDLLVTKIRTGIQEEGLTLDVYGRFAGDLPFLRSLSQATGYFPAGTTSISLDTARARAAGLRGTAVLRPAFPNYWGEKDDFLKTGIEPSFDQGRDLQPPLIFGWALEKGGISDERIQAGSSRMLVVGNADFLDDSTLNRAVTDVDFAMLSLNWLTDREELLGIPPKRTHFYFLDFSAGQLDRILFLVVLAVPAAAGIAGMLVWMVRRR